jgi:hydrogenase maturation protease
MTPNRMATRILCIGNEFVRDDGLGIRVGRVLASLPLPPEVTVVPAPQLGFDLLDEVASADRLILVDAMKTDRPVGTCVTLDGRAIERYSAGASASHTLGIAELMELACTLSPGRSPATLHFVGVEGRAFEDYGLAMTPEVEAAIPHAVESVLRLLGADEVLLAAGHTAALDEIANPKTTIGKR